MPDRIWTNPTGLIFSKRTQRMLLLGLELLVLARAAAVHLAAATIEGIRMAPQNNSMVARLLINAEQGKSISIEYADAVQSGAWRALTNVVVTSNPFAFVDLNSAGVEKRFYRLAAPGNLPANPDPARLVWIPPGTFTMGSPAGEQDRYSWEGPQTAVTLTQGFYMGKYEVTQREYLAVMGTNSSYFVEGRIVTTTPPPPVLPPPIEGDLNRPAEWVSWNDAVSYCSKLTPGLRGWQYWIPGCPGPRSAVTKFSS